MDPDLEKKLDRFCDGLEEVLPYFSPVEQVIAQAIHEYWQARQPAAKGAP